MSEKISEMTVLSKAAGIDRVEVAQDQGSGTFATFAALISQFGGVIWSEITENLTAAVGHGYICDASSGAVTVTFPASPTEGAQVGIIALDLTNALTLDGNGHDIGGSSTFNVDTVGAGMVYIFTSKGWVVKSEGAIKNTEWTGDNWTSTTDGVTSSKIQSALKEVGVRYADRASTIEASDNGRLIEAFYSNDSWSANNTSLSAGDANMVAYWAMSDMTDYVNGYDIDNPGDAPLVAGKNGSAVHVSSSHSLHMPTHTSDLYMQSYDFTISLWCKTPASGSYDGCLFILGNWGCCNISMWLDIGERHFHIYCASGNTYYNVDTTTTVDFDTWYHYVLVRDGDYLRQYINGVEEATTDVTGKSFGRDDPLPDAWFGDTNDTNAPADCLLDEIGVWKQYALTAAQVADLYNGGAGAFYDPNVTREFRLSDKTSSDIGGGSSGGTTIPRWDSGISYNTDDMINYEGELYVSLVDSNAGNQPDTRPAEWKLFNVDITLGETDTTAYRGDRGKTAYDHSQLTSGNPHAVTKTDVGLDQVDNTSDADKPISTATQTALNNKADKTNVLELNNTTAFTPDTDYEPATKKYVDDTVSGALVDDEWTGDNWASTTDGITSSKIQNALKEVGISYADRASTIEAADDGRIVAAFYNNDSWSANNATLSVADPNMVIYWAMSDLTDYANDYDLTNPDGTAQVQGKNGSGFYLTSDEHLYMPTHTNDLYMQTNDFTISMWFKTPASGSSDGLILTIGAYGCCYIGMWLDMDNRHFHMECASGNDYIGADTTTTVDFDTWYHYVLVRDGDYLRQYINGVEEAATDVTGRSFGRDDPLPNVTLGTNGYSSNVTGTIDEVGIWKAYAFSASEVADLYNGGSGAFYNPAVTREFRLSDKKVGDTTGGLAWYATTTNTTVENLKGYLCDTSGGAITLTFPASPAEGDQIGIVALDLTNALTLDGNGHNVSGSATINVDIEGAGMTYVYSATKGWVVSTEINSGGSSITSATVDCTTADQTYTMPTIDASNDGQTYRVGKIGDYKLVIQPANTTDSIGGSGAGYGIETLDGGNAFVTLLSDLTNNKYYIADNSNRWGVEGARMYLPLHEQSVYRLDNTTTITLFADGVFVGRSAYGYNELAMNIDSLFGGRYFPVPSFDGANRYLIVKHEMLGGDADLVASNTDSWTLSIMVKFDNANASEIERIVGQHEDIDNRYFLYRSTNNKVYYHNKLNGTNDVLIGNLVISDTDWHQIDVVKVGVVFALYIDGVFSVTASATTFKAFTGALFFAQDGAGTQFLDGKLSDFFIVQQNLYGVDPTDSNSTVPVRIKPAKGGLIND